MVYPFDTLKTRMQSADYDTRYKNPETGAIRRNFLFRGLYQGVWSVVFATIPACLLSSVSWYLWNSICPMPLLTYCCLCSRSILHHLRRREIHARKSHIVDDWCPALAAIPEHNIFAVSHAHYTRDCKFVRGDCFLSHDHAGGGPKTECTSGT